MKRIIIFSSIIILILLTISSMIMINSAKTELTIQEKSSNNSTTKEKNFIPFTANFTIITNNTKRDFSNPMYHNLSDKVFITTSNPEQIYIATPNVSWKDFFDTLPPPFSLTSTCLTTGTGQNFCMTNKKNLIFYLNKKSTPKLLLEKINPNDNLIIFYGDDQNVTDVLGASTSATQSILQKKEK